jgi:hypothetical protein
MIIMELHWNIINVDGDIVAAFHFSSDAASFVAGRHGFCITFRRNGAVLWREGFEGWSAGDRLEIMEVLTERAIDADLELQAAVNAAERSEG